MKFEDAVAQAASIEVPIVPEDREYYVVRSNQGVWYGDFKAKKMVAMGPAFVDAEDLEKVIKATHTRDTVKGEENKKAARLEVNRQVANVAKRASAEIGVPAKDLLFQVRQLATFFSRMRKGDVVLVPQGPHGELAIGVVKSDYLSTVKLPSLRDPDKTAEYYMRPVDWHSFESMDLADPRLVKAIASNRALRDITESREVIDAAMHPLYERGGYTYLRMWVTKPGRVQANAMEILFKGLRLADEISNSTERTTVKTQVNSTGPVDVRADRKTINTTLAGIGIVALIGATAGVVYVGGELSGSGGTDGTVGFSLTTTGVQGRAQTATDSRNAFVMDSIAADKTFSMQEDSADLANILHVLSLYPENDVEISRELLQKMVSKFGDLDDESIEARTETEE